VCSSLVSWPRASSRSATARSAREIALVNCPFHRLAEEHRSLVCGMNLDFLAGLLEGIGPSDRLDARLEPEPGYCCVRIKAA
jgi:predicted ArsR family transcriptional regulator